jgi:aromatic-L-amino-acid decarboxylase
VGADPEAEEETVTFRDDLDRAADWVDAYLQRVADLPVTPSVSPGDVRATLPEAPPEQGEAFEAMLRDFDELVEAEASATKERNR